MLKEHPGYIHHLTQIKLNDFVKLKKALLFVNSTMQVAQESPFVDLLELSQKKYKNVMIVWWRFYTNFIKILVESAPTVLQTIREC